MKWGSIAAVLLGALAEAAPALGEEHPAAHVFIVAEASQVRFLEDLSHPTDQVQFSRLYSVTLNKIRVLSGSAAVPGTLTVKMTGIEEGAIRPHTQMAIMLQFDEHQVPLVLFWERTYTVACVPHNLVTDGNLPKEDFNFHRSDAMDCASVDYLH